MDHTVPNVQQDYPSIGDFISPAVGSFEEKVKDYANQQGHGYCLNHGKIRVELCITSKIYTDPVGVTKAILDGLTGVVFYDDSMVKELIIEYRCDGSSPPTTMVTVMPLSDDFGELNMPGYPLQIEIPHTPVEKGLCYCRYPNHKVRAASTYWGYGCSMVELDSMVAQINKSRSLTNTLHVDLLVKSSANVGDIDNVLRGYLDELSRNRNISLDRITKHSIRLYDQLILDNVDSCDRAVITIQPIDNSVLQL